jgi:hypothetical protein
MSIESAIFSRLSGFTGLADLIVSRIYPLILPQGCALPAVTYQRVATAPREVAMGGDPGIASPRFQVTAWAGNFDEARAVAEQVRLALERWSDSDNQVDDTYIVMEIDGYDPETLEYSSVLDVVVIHREAV